MIRRVGGATVAAALLTTSCAALGVSSGCSGTTVIARFEQVGDLVPDSNVQSSDVEIGTVTDITLDRSTWEAKVEMCIDAAEPIPADSDAVVRTTSLLGEKFVDLRPRSDGPPFLEDGDVIGAESTSKATELEDVFAKLAGVLGAGNLEQLNRFTSAQAEILRGRAGRLRALLARLRDFTSVLAERRHDIASAVDSLDAVARTLLADSGTVRRFLRSFADSSAVLASQKGSLKELLASLDRFTNVSVQLLTETEQGLNEQFAKLRPVLRTAVANSRNVRATLRTLATFAEWWPESMPGDYLQLDVCFAPPEHYEQGTGCPQSDTNDDPRAAAGARAAPATLETILRQPVRER